ncbi:UNVERIFIED_CONTAM: hypothetical protein Cloal_3299 [Acetivibrio alkalicellulosi]
MRINLFISFLISLLLSSKIVIAAFVLAEQRPYYLFIIPAVFLLLTIVFKKINHVKKIVFIIPISLTYLAFLLFITFSIVNYSNEELTETKLRHVIATEEEVKAGQNLYELLEQFDKSLDDTDRGITIDSDNSSVAKVLDKTSEKRAEIFELIKSNDIYVNQHIFNEDMIQTVDNPDKLPIMLVIFKTEMLQVEYYRLEGKYQEAVDKYVELWYNAAQTVDIKGNNFTGTLIYIAITRNLGEYFYNNQDFFSSYDLSEVSRLKDSILGGLDKSFERAFASEYNFNHDQFKKVEKARPFFDLYRYLRKLDEFYFTMVEAIKVPYENYDKLEKLVEESNVESLWRIFKYMEEIPYKQTVDMLSGICENTVRIKNALSIYFYAMDKNNYQDIPIDFVTGERFITRDLPEHIEIEFTLFNKSDLYTYKIKK